MKYKLLFIMLLAYGIGWGQLLQWKTFGNVGTETTEPSFYNDANISSANLTQGTITAAANGNRFGGRVGLILAIQLQVILYQKQLLEMITYNLL